MKLCVCSIDKSSVRILLKLHDDAVVVASVCNLTLSRVSGSSPGVASGCSIVRIMSAK